MQLYVAWILDNILLIHYIIHIFFFYFKLAYIVCWTECNKSCSLDLNLEERGSGEGCNALGVWRADLFLLPCFVSDPFFLCLWCLRSLGCFLVLGSKLGSRAWKGWGKLKRKPKALWPSLGAQGSPQSLLEGLKVSHVGAMELNGKISRVTNFLY